MITIHLGERYMDHEMRQWLLLNIGPMDDTWNLLWDNKLVFKNDADATYFTLIDKEKHLGRKWRGL